MIRWPDLALGLAIAILNVCAHAQTAVRLEGRVLHPGDHQLGTEARLLDAVRAAAIRPDAYLLGAAWLHADSQASQRALKLGLLFDLGVIARSARLHGRLSRAELAERLAIQLGVMAVTGREVNTMDPVRLELDPRANRRLSSGDRIVYPSRPSDVTVRGAVSDDCVLAFVALRSAAEYVRNCSLHSEADADWVYIVQPEGVVVRRGVAVWNGERSEPPAPGAQIVVPLRDGGGSDGDDELVEGGIRRFNDALATFIATQPLKVEVEALR